MPNDLSREYTYTALHLAQQPGAPALYLLTVDAPGLLEWADVPNAKADYMAGYQRVYNADRAREITEFLANDPNNIIPGAIIVTVAPDAVEVVKTEDPALVRVTVHAQEHTFDERLANVYTHFSQRLSDSERESIDETPVDPVEAAVEADDANENGIPESYIATLTAELRTAQDDISSVTVQGCGVVLRLA